MVIGERFVWLHFPKCAGTETEAVLRFVPGLTHDPLDGPVIWHHTLQQRREFDPAFRPAQRVTVANFRRLPAWLLSKIHFSQGQGAPTPSRVLLDLGRFHEPDGSKASCDDFVRAFAPGVRCWLRVEHLAEDMRRVFDGLCDLPDLSWALQHRNVGVRPYDRDVWGWFDEDQMAALYAANPLWAALERRIYGATLADLGRPGSLERVSELAAKRERRDANGGSAR